MTQHLTSRWYHFFRPQLLLGLFLALGGCSWQYYCILFNTWPMSIRYFPYLVTRALYVVSDSTAPRRVTALLLCGFIAGFGWWAVFRYGRPLVSIANAIKSPRPYMPIKTTLAHVFLQIITVALGSPMGREVAPRELGATFACWLTNKLKLHPKESQILVACAAGAGLAAVYNVPLGGALLPWRYYLEVFAGLQ